MTSAHGEPFFEQPKVPAENSSCRKPSSKTERRPSMETCAGDNDGNPLPLSNDFASFESVRSYLEFYESIPDYRELDHLSNEEFYSRLRSLKITQTQFCGGSWSEEFEQKEKNSNGRFDFEKKTKSKTFCVCCSVCFEDKVPTNKVREDAADLCVCCFECPVNKFQGKNWKVPKSSKRSPKINVISDNENNSDIYELKKFSGYEADQESSSLQPGEKTSGKLKKAEVECFDVLESCSKRSRSLPISPGCGCPTPELCHRLSEVSFSDLISRCASGYCMSEKLKRQTMKPRKVHSRPIPITSRIPLFDKIMLEKETRRRIIHDKYSEELRSLVKPFSFTRREEERERYRMISSNPELTSLPSSTIRFRAKPIPKNLFSNYAYERMKEEEFYRALKRKIRAEEMLKASSLPPSMARRERMKRRSKSLDFFDYGSPSRNWNKVCGYGKMCKEVDKEMKIDKRIKNKNKKTNSVLSNNIKRISSAMDSSTELSPYNSVLLPNRRQRTRPHSAINCSRNNLASVLRIETARRRLEKEMEERLRDSRVKREAKFKARLLRMTPAWRALGHDKDEDWALRLAARREEEKEKREAHRRLMESIYGRVYKIPPLFQRQTLFARKNSRNEISIHGEESPNLFYEANTTEEPSGENLKKCFGLPAFSEGKDTNGIQETSAVSFGERKN